MTPDEIEKHVQDLIDQLGLSPNVIGLADTKIGYGNYQKILATYQQMLNDTLVLMRELAEEVKALQQGVK